MAPYGDPLPMCPICTTTKPYNVESRSPLGFECLNCRTIFTGDQGEADHPKNRKRRRIVAEYARHQAQAEGARCAADAEGP